MKALFMIRLLFLASPIFVSFFWLLTLHESRKTHSVPRAYLTKFMLLPLLCFLSHFFYFAPVPAAFTVFDIVLTIAGGLIFPMYHIYFRLLTVDEKFTFRFHYRYMVIPFIVIVMYGVGVVLTPRNEYRVWLFQQDAFPESAPIRFLNFMRIVLRIHALLQVVFTIVGNYILIRNNRVRAEQFYADINDGSYRNVKILNTSIICMGLATGLALVVGRHLLMPGEIIICVLWSVFAAMIYIIGYMGLKLLPVNLAFDSDCNADEVNQILNLTADAHTKIREKLLIEFEQNKIFLNKELNILDLVPILGTNRTYISTLINQQFNQNFCSFVNGYRILELEGVFPQNREYSNEVLAEICGFGSVNSMKRAILTKTGMSLSLWKEHVLKQK